MGRNSNGTFGIGNSGGPGRPRKAVETKYLMAITDSVSLEDWQAICKRAADDAKAGDVKAREWLAHYLVGNYSLREVAIDLKFDHI